MKQRFNIKRKEHLDNVLNQLSRQPIPDTGWVLTLEEGKNNRSLAQQALLWSQVYTPIAEQISEATGTMMTKQKVHEFLKDRYSPRVIYKFLDETKSYPKSTTKYTKQEMSDYIEKCYAWGAEHMVWFP